MKLKIYNAENSATILLDKPIIRMNAKTGMLSFSKQAVRLLELSDEKGVIVANDEESPKDWFIRVCHDKMAYKVKCGNNDKKGMVFFSSTAIVRKVFSTLGITKNSVGFQISRQPVVHEGLQYWLIITVSPFGIR